MAFMVFSSTVMIQPIKSGISAIKRLSTSSPPLQVDLCLLFSSNMNAQVALCNVSNCWACKLQVHNTERKHDVFSRRKPAMYWEIAFLFFSILQFLRIKKVEKKSCTKMYLEALKGYSWGTLLFVLLKNRVGTLQEMHMKSLH